MKIIIVGPVYPLRGGIAHYIALLAAHLRQRHEVEIVSFKRQYPKLLFPGKTQEEKGGAAPPVRSEALIDSVNPINWIGVALKIRRRRPDLVVFKYWLPFFAPCFGTIAAIARWQANTKVLCICDNIIPHERRLGDRLTTRYFFRFVDYFIVQSSVVEKELKQFVPNARYQKVSHPIYEIFGDAVGKEEARRKLGITAERMILFFGYVRPYKGLPILLEAMPSILKEIDLLLYVVGEFYEREEKYTHQIKRLCIEKNVRIIPDYVPNEQVALFFSACDIVVLPYVSATQSGIVQIAYQFDKPVIATDVGGLAEVVLDAATGFIVPAKDSEALARAVVKFYTEKKEQEFVENVRRQKAAYSWERLIHAIEELTRA